jgi:hypothetical protein
MVNDSFGALQQGRTAYYYDYQPPAFAWFLGFVDKFLPVPSTILALNLALIEAGIYLVLLSLIPNVPRASLATCAVMLFPVSLLGMGTLTRDTTGLGLFLVSVATAVAPNASTFKKFTIVSVLSFFNIALRENAPLSLVPIFLYIAILRPFKHLQQRFLDLVISMALLGITISCAFLVNISLTDEKTYVRQVPLIHHLLLLSEEVGLNLLPVETFPSFTLNELKVLRRTHANSSALYHYVWHAFYERNVPLCPRLNGRQLKELEKIFAQSLLNFPSQSLEVRVRSIAPLLTTVTDDLFGKKNPQLDHTAGLLSDPPGLSGFRAADHFSSYLRAMSVQFLPLTPSFYLALSALFLFSFSLRKFKVSREYWALWTSSFLHYASYLCLVSHWEFRWGLQSIVLSTLISVAIVVSWLSTKKYR